MNSLVLNPKCDLTPAFHTPMQIVQRQSQTQAIPFALQFLGLQRTSEASHHCPSLIHWWCFSPFPTKPPSLLLHSFLRWAPSPPFGLRSRLTQWHIFRGAFSETKLICLCSLGILGATFDHSWWCSFKTFTSKLSAGFTAVYPGGRRNSIWRLPLFPCNHQHKAWPRQGVHSFIINLVYPQVQSPFIYPTSINHDKGQWYSLTSLSSKPKLDI